MIIIYVLNIHLNSNWKIILGEVLMITQYIVKVVLGTCKIWLSNAEIFWFKQWRQFFFKCLSFTLFVSFEYLCYGSMVIISVHFFQCGDPESDIQKS